jgi:hypothetical protein
VIGFARRATIIESISKGNFRAARAGPRVAAGLNRTRGRRMSRLALLRAAVAALLMGIEPAVTADSARLADTPRRVCYLDLQSLAAPACAAPKPQAVLR